MLDRRHSLVRIVLSARPLSSIPQNQVSTDRYLLVVLHNASTNRFGPHYCRKCIPHQGVYKSRLFLCFPSESLVLGVPISTTLIAISVELLFVEAIARRP